MKVKICKKCKHLALRHEYLAKDFITVCADCPCGQPNAEFDILLWKLIE
jgi:hypothetical protein